MRKVKNMEKYINNSMLDNIYKQRKENLYSLTNYDVEEKKKIEKEYPVNYTLLELAVKNLPPHFKNCREYILDNLEIYVNRENLLSYYENEKFYKVGFCDGVRMILEIMGNKDN